MSSDEYDYSGWVPEIKEDLEIFEEFLKESKFRMEDIESGIMQLEENPEDADIVNDLLCQFHSIKGSASLLHITFISKLGHEIESRLEEARDGNLKLDRIFIDNLLKASDKLKEMIKVVAEEVDKVKG